MYRNVSLLKILTNKVYKCSWNNDLVEHIY